MIREQRQLLDRNSQRSRVRDRQRPIECHAAVTVFAVAVERLVISGSRQSGVSHGGSNQTPTQTPHPRQFTPRGAPPPPPPPRPAPHLPKNSPLPLPPH